MKKLLLVSILLFTALVSPSRPRAQSQASIAGVSNVPAILRTGIIQAWCTGAVTSSATSFFAGGFGSSTTACTGVTTAAGGMKMGSAGVLKNLQVNLSAGGKAGDKVSVLKNGSTAGAPNCTYGTGTSCSDVSTTLTFAAGDVITFSVVTGTSDGSANLSVALETWN